MMPHTLNFLVHYSLCQISYPFFFVTFSAILMRRFASQSLQELREGHIQVIGKTTSELKFLLQDQFNIFHLDPDTKTTDINPLPQI